MGLCPEWDLIDYAYKIKKLIISANNATASDNANPIIAYVNNCCFNDGFLAYPNIKLPNTIPIPAPDPATPTHATPAPMNLLASTIFFYFLPPPLGPRRGAMIPKGIIGGVREHLAPELCSGGRFPPFFILPLFPQSFFSSSMEGEPLFLPPTRHNAGPLSWPPFWGNIWGSFVFENPSQGSSPSGLLPPQPPPMSGFPRQGGGTIPLEIRTLGPPPLGGSGPFLFPSQAGNDP
jgi:hypothetical protein